MGEDYSEEDLRSKKYPELLKISKNYGVKTSKRLKMDKLIEAILKSQREASRQTVEEETAKTVPAPSEVTANSPPEELLLDVEFPECESKDFLESSVDLSEDPIGDTEKDDVPPNAEDKTHKQSGTYELDEDDRNGGREGGKRQRKSTFELPGQNDVTLPIDEKQTEENSKQVKALSEKGRVGSRRNGVATKTPKIQVTRSSTQSDSKEDGSVTSKRRHSQTEPVLGNLPSSPWQARVSLSSSAKRRRQSVVVTPSAPAPPLRPSRQSRGTPGNPAAAPKVTTAASASKPVFTIGCGDKKDPAEKKQENIGAQGKGSSAIPRFMSYARRLKMPNFARIHEQAFERMEALDDYVDKCKARQGTLGSTAKKQNNNKVFQPSVTTVKNLNFNFAETQSVTKTPQPASDKPQQQNSASRVPSAKRQKRGTNTPADTSARLSRRVTQDATKLKSATVTKKDSRVFSKPSPKSTKKPSPKSALKPTQKIGRGQRTSPRRGQKQSMNPGTKTSPKTSDKLPPKEKTHTSINKSSAVSFPVFGSQLKENCRPAGKQGVSSPMVSKLPMRNESTKRMQVTAGLSKKSNVKPLKSRDNLKTLAERRHIIKSSKEIREGQRGILKGVRLNRRFELQMAKRGVAL